jgi:HD-like signal output (HDOD) protein
MLKLKRTRADDGASELRRALGNFDPPTIPGLVTTAIEQVSSPDCDMRQVADTVGRDPGLSARLLSVVNSAAYAPRNPIVGVAQAVTMFGKNQLESMLISVAASRVVASKPTPGFDMNRFWTVAAWRASAAASLSKRVDRARSSENFSAALLEDIAVPLLVAGQPRYSRVLADWRAGAGELTDLEQETFGWTHNIVAGWLFDEWGFPASLRDAVTEVGRPEDGAVAYPVVRVVSSLSAPGEPAEVIEKTTDRISTVFGMPEDQATSLLEAARIDGATLAQSLA